MSGQYEKGEYIHPLHQLDKEHLVSEETVNALETHYHEELQKQDDAYLSGFASRMRAAIYQEEAAIEKKPVRPRTANLELER